MKGKKEKLEIGHLVEVKGNRLSAVLRSNLPENMTMTADGVDYVVGQMGSYVSIHGRDHIVGIVTGFLEREEALTTQEVEEAKKEEHIPLSPSRHRLSISPVGTIDSKGKFSRGVARYPTVGDSVHILSRDEINVIFERYVSGQYQVGHLSAFPELPVYLDVTALYGRHLAVLGQTGSGKSWALASLLQKAMHLMTNTHIILLDIHGEYRNTFDKWNGRLLSATELEIPYWLLTFQELIDLCVDRSEHEAPNQIAYFQNEVLEAKIRAAKKEKLGNLRITVDTPVYFSFEEVLTAIRHENEKMVEGQRGPKKGELHGIFSHLLMRLESKLNDRRYNFLLQPSKRTSSSSMSPLLKEIIGIGRPKAPITVIDLSTAPFDVRPTVVALLSRLIFEFNYWNPFYTRFPILLAIEEAHTVVPRGGGAFDGARRQAEKIAKEGRKYGVGLVVISQRPSEVSETVLAQCGNFICLRLTNPDDQAYVRKLVPESEEGLMDTLAGLRRGEALALGEAAPLPTRMTLDIPSPGPRSDDVDFRKEWSNDLTDLDVDMIVTRWREQER